MKDQLINLETAKLAKEKGFNFGSSRATQSLLQKWLREKHNIFAESEALQKEPNKLFFIPILATIDEYGYLGRILIKYEHYNSHEQALEKGLFEALKLIK